MYKQKVIWGTYLRTSQKLTKVKSLYQWALTGLLGPLLIELDWEIQMRPVSICLLHPTE